MVLTRCSEIINGVAHGYDKPSACPHCGVTIDAKRRQALSIDDYRLNTFSCTHPECRKIFAVLYGKVDENRLFPLLWVYPPAGKIKIANELEETSKRFIVLYRQAENAENNEDFDLAACGYRNAVEALVKDYAIMYKGAETDERLMRKSLQDCITDYLDGLDEAVAAFVVKELGNSATHYPIIGEPFDFKKQKAYLTIFLGYMQGKILVQSYAKNIPKKHIDKITRNQEKVT